MRTRLMRRILPLTTVAALALGVALGAPAASTVTIKMATNSALGAKILVSSNGLTLYHYVPEKKGKIVCTGACATDWPPVLVTGTAKPLAGPGADRGEARHDQAARREDAGHLQRPRAVPVLGRQEGRSGEGPGRGRDLVRDHAHRRRDEGGGRGPHEVERLHLGLHRDVRLDELERLDVRLDERRCRRRRGGRRCGRLPSGSDDHRPGRPLLQLLIETRIGVRRAGSQPALSLSYEHLRTL